MKFTFPNDQAVNAANNELSNHFSGNGVHYETLSSYLYIKILSNCPDMSRAAAICRKYGGVA